MEVRTCPTVKKSIVYQAVSRDLDNEGYDFSPFLSGRKWSSLKTSYTRNLFCAKNETSNWQYWAQVHDILIDPVMPGTFLLKPKLQLQVQQQISTAVTDAQVQRGSEHEYEHSNNKKENSSKCDE